MRSSKSEYAVSTVGIFATDDLDLEPDIDIQFSISIGTLMADLVRPHALLRDKKRRLTREDRTTECESEIC
jgi:hypothetical protein